MQTQSLKQLLFGTPATFDMLLAFKSKNAGRAGQGRAGQNRAEQAEQTQKH